MPPTFPLSPSKPSLFQCLTRLRLQITLFCNSRRRGVPNCSSLAIFAGPDTSNQSLLLHPGDLGNQNCCVFQCLGWSPFKNCTLNQGKIHHKALDIERQRQTQENRRNLQSNLDVQDLPESSVHTRLPVSRTIPTVAVWA